MPNQYGNLIPIVVSGATAGLSAATAADVQVIPVPFKCEVRRCAVVWQTTGAAQAIVEFDRRVLAGSDTGRVNIVAITKPAAENQGKYLYKDPATKVTLDAGDEIVVQVTDVEAAATFGVVILVDEIPEVAANQGDMVASA